MRTPKEHTGPEAVSRHEFLGTSVLYVNARIEGDSKQGMKQQEWHKFGKG